MIYPMTTRGFRCFAVLMMAGFTLVVSGQQHAKPDPKQQPQSGDHPAPTPTPPVPAQHVAAPTQQANAYSPNQQHATETIWIASAPKSANDYIMTGANVVLALVGVAGVWVALGNLGKLREQTTAIQRQADLAEQEIEILRESTAATKTSVEIAQKNIDLLIAKERAHLRPLPGALQLLQRKVGEIDVIVRLAIANHGATNAFIESAEAGIRIYESAAPEYDPFINFISLTDLLPGETESDEIIFRETTDKQRFENGRVFVHLFGTVVYRDVFLVHPREMTFYFVWDNTRHEWERRGEEHNKHG